MPKATEIDPALCLRIATTCGFYRMRRAARVVSRRIETAFEDEELTPNQLLILIGLKLTGGAKMQSLADLLGLDHSTLSRTLTPLVEGGLVRQVPGADGRASPLELTHAGQSQAVRGVKAWEKFQAGLESSLGAQRWARLSADLDAVIALEAAAAPPEGQAPKPPRARRRAR